MAWTDRLAVLGFDDSQSALYWNLVYAGGQTGAYCVGFEQITGHPGGFLGTAGFRPDAPPRQEWFDAILDGPKGGRVDCLIGLAGNRVYLIHFAARRVDLIADDLSSPICSLGSRPPRVYSWTSPDLGPVVLTALRQPDAKLPQRQTIAYSMVIRTDDAIHIVDFASTQHESPPFHGQDDTRYQVVRRRRFPLPEALRNESFLVAPRRTAD